MDAPRRKSPLLRLLGSFHESQVSCFLFPSMRTGVKSRVENVRRGEARQQPAEERGDCIGRAARRRPGWVEKWIIYDETARRPRFGVFAHLGLPPAGARKRGRAASSFRNQASTTTPPPCHLSLFFFPFFPSPLLPTQQPPHHRPPSLTSCTHLHSPQLLARSSNNHPPSHHQNAVDLHLLVSPAVDAQAEAQVAFNAVVPHLAHGQGPS